MERRKFLKTTGLASLSVPFLFNNNTYAAVTEKLFRIEKSLEDRVLVLIRLNGGNDGLHTVIPLDYYSNLTKQRTNIILPSFIELPQVAQNLNLFKKFLFHVSIHSLEISLLIN